MFQAECHAVLRATGLLVRCRSDGGVDGFDAAAHFGCRGPLTALILRPGKDLEAPAQVIEDPSVARKGVHFRLRDTNGVCQQGKGLVRTLVQDQCVG